MAKRKPARTERAEKVPAGAIVDGDDTSVAAYLKLEKKLLAMNDDDRVRHLRKHVKLLRSKLTEAETGAKLFRSVIEDVYSEPLDIRLPKLPSQGAGKGHTVEEAMLHLSDLHFGKITKGYNFLIATERCQKIAETVISITDVRRSRAQIDTIHLMFGGDFIEGQNIFPGQPHMIDLDIVDQAIKKGPEVIVELILSLLAYYKRIVIKGVPGNHGRTGGKHDGGNPRMNNDSLFYHVTRLLLENALLRNHPDRLGDIEWDLPWDRDVSEDPQSEGWHAIDRILGWGIFMVHGHQISGGFAGFPWYGSGKRAWGWIDTIQQGWDYLLHGHFHTACAFDLNRRHILANGSTESFNHHARENMAACGGAKQRLAFFTREKGLITDELIFLEDRKPNR
jgi:hypothetical protein